MTRIVRTALVVLVCAGTARAQAAPAVALRDSIARARAAQEAREPGALEEDLGGAFDAAIAEGGAAPDALARAYLDAGSLLVERGSLDPAAEMYREADLWASERGLRARARFNYAQVRYRQAVEAMSPTEEKPAPDVELTKSRLLDSANAFRAVLDLDPRDSEAARNTERVRRMIRALDEMQQRAQDKADEMRQQADELDELADRQQQESIQNDQQSQGSDTASRDQSELSEETQQRSQDVQESQPGSAAQESLREAMEQQERAKRELEQGDPTEASEAQLEAAKELREAAEALRQEADQQGGEPQEGSGKEGEPQDGEQGDEGDPSEQEGESESDRISDWLLNREEQQREQRDRQLRAIRGRSVPVERDW